ncbi:MAG: hypothetical protein FJ060_08175 [Cyanobacteria bacterium K_Offshore_0m_m2_072]|nr:hypothetical protein [Cyanobacteria bacterium K_Offshore_0m_m2_072]
MATEIPYHQDRLAWPESALETLQSVPAHAHQRRGVLEQRLGNQRLAEIQLLASLQSDPDHEPACTTFELLCGLHLRRHQQALARELILRAVALANNSTDAQQAALAWRSRQLDLAERRSANSVAAETPLERLQQFQQLLLAGDRAAIEEFLSQWPKQLASPEAIELKGRALKWLGHSEQAMAVLGSLLARNAGSPSAWQAALELNILGGRSNGLTLSTACRLHPHDPGIACHRVLIQLTDRQPAMARRSAYKERILYSLGKPIPSYKQSDSNLIAAYDHSGRTDLTPYLHPSLLNRINSSPPLHANVTMQLAASASVLYGPRAEAHGCTFPKRQPLTPRRQRAPLRVGLISPDFHYHPVGRFIQMLVATGLGQPGELHLINTGQSALPGLQENTSTRLHQLNAVPAEAQLELVRQLEMDVAIDLAGWTGNNNGQLFAQGLAPVQINYLGYFGSSGLPAMDVWLGDDVLFPNPMQEWHSERIVRLPRPFLAWQPDASLPEGRVAVPPAPQGPITFGCFNHVRKLSAGTLSLWAQILKAIPGSRLALKAYTSDDPGVVALVEKRMRRCGLDPAAVIWLPTCPKPEDHLRQYGLIDITLDPFPNGGCTTTCEALWMGVPVITLLGSHYVSRMAAAVLHGAHLPEWVASSKEHYLKLACQAADQLSAIRRGRSALRAHLQASPLGDATDLAEHLWQCFENLA